MTGFVKLYGTILDSSIWGEPLSARITWITMLAMADQYGFVAASSDGIARRANLSLKATEQSLALLEAPDTRSKSPEFEGRRIERVDGGWQILNYRKYRELQTDKQVADAERQRNHRKEKRDTSQKSQNVTPRSRDVATEAEAEAEAETTTATSLTRGGPFLTQLLEKVPDPRPWEAEVNACLSAMPGHHHATVEQIERAARDMLANGKAQHPNIRQFRRYVEGAVAEDQPRPNGARAPKLSHFEQSLLNSRKAFGEIAE